MRLNRFLAAAGFGSRRACDELIRSGKVSVNGHFIRELATTVGEGDDVRVAGRPARPARPVSLLFYKPRGIVCTRSDERGRPTIFELIPAHFGRLVHVGRLDKESEGLILLTNDGDLAQALAHPSHGVEKEYEVVIDKPLETAHAARLLRGFSIEGGRARAERVRTIAPAVLRIVLRQGIKRQIRLMLFRLGYEVKRLVRVRLGGLGIGTLPPGHWRLLKDWEIALLKGSDKKAP